MGIEPPFLYDPPSRWSDIGLRKPFNPKAVTEAAQNPPTPKKKTEGPFINFNVHPDSYLILPYGNVNHSPMSRHTKTNVRVARGIQLVLRSSELLVTLTILVFVICLRNFPETVSWCFRIPPCVGLVHTLYGAYHHIRSATTKPPATTASYNFVAAGLDTGLIPFYAFICLLCSNQLDESSIGWTSVFNDVEKTRTIIHLTFILAIVMASMHWISLLLSLFLAVIFRKITRLPPDLNPLESNLTTRHKKKMSEASSHRWSKSTTFNSSEAGESPRESVNFSISHTIPFMHTRVSSVGTGATASSNRYSRTDLPSQVNTAASARLSRTELARASAQLPKRASRAQMLSHESVMRNSRDMLSTENWYAYLGAQNEGNENQARSSTMLSDYTRKSDASVYHSLAEDEDDADDRGTINGHEGPEMDLADEINIHVREINQQLDGEANWHAEDSSDEDGEHRQSGEDISRPSSAGTVETYPATRTLGFNPLGLNPPTPNPEIKGMRHASPAPAPVVSHGRSSLVAEVLNVADEEEDDSDGAAPPPVIRTGPKSRFYGDLRAGTPPVMGPPRKPSVIDLTIDDDDSSGTRVVSSGSDFLSASRSVSSRKRDVSGKVAEEGRGGAWWNAARRTLSGRRIRED